MRREICCGSKSRIVRIQRLGGQPRAGVRNQVQHDNFVAFQQRQILGRDEGHGHEIVRGRHGRPRDLQLMQRQSVAQLLRYPRHEQMQIGPPEARVADENGADVPPGSAQGKSLAKTHKRKS